MSGWRAVLVITGLFLFSWGLTLLILEPGAVLAFLLPETGGYGSGTHLYLVGPLAAIPVIVRFLAGVPWFICCAAGVLIPIAVLAVSVHDRHPLTPAVGKDIPKWRDSRTRLLDSIRRDLRRFR